MSKGMWLCVAVAHNCNALFQTQKYLVVK